MTGMLWKYSGDLDEDDFEFARHEFISRRTAMQYYGLSEKVLMTVAYEAGAVYKFGKMVRLKREILEAYMRDDPYLNIRMERGYGPIYHGNGGFENGEYDG